MAMARGGGGGIESGKPLDSKQVKNFDRSNKESHDKNSKFNRDLASLGSDIYRKRETKRDRFKASATSDSVTASVRGLKSKQMKRQESAGADSVETGLSLVEVSDLSLPP
jgi:hypothetical protein